MNGKPAQAAPSLEIKPSSKCHNDTKHDFFSTVSENIQQLPIFEEAVKASSEENAAALVSGRQAQPGSASPVIVRENVPGMPSISN